MLSNFNRFEYGGNLLIRLDVTYELACMVTQEEEYYMDLLETMIENNDRSKTPFSKEKLQKEINTIVAKRKRNNITQ